MCSYSNPHDQLFRVLGDLSHFLSKCILIYAIHRNKSTEGVSLITQGLYCLVFITRYLDVFMEHSLWNILFKIFYILSSLYILFLMLRVYARTREREKAWQLGGVSFVGSAVLAPFVMLIFTRKVEWSFTEVCWTFSIVLESTCILPQLLLLRQTTVPTVIDSFYLVMLGSYRGFYILNWIYREFDDSHRKPNAPSIIFGVIQTAFYVDFFWVYYTRQRVKLRHGGLVDADDMRRGWLLRTVFGNKTIVGNIDEDEHAPALGDEEDGHARPDNGPRSTNSKWGSRGISVSADEGVLDGNNEIRVDPFTGQEEGIVDAAEDFEPDAKIKDPDELAKILDDDEDDSDDGVLPGEGSAAVGNGSEWRDGSK
ncbi:ER lumen protein-retaining receptor A [Lachnellula occidentalis]|uniref:ER lumen protein-retaining receptor A n=1 Tax=Lachnellula occidentalis TaxID=215460 RepID=A0A8H8S4A9_9HELO|nr:ER lumen protein-retaining receptor A [Lachnellula occidentalis]